MINSTAITLKEGEGESFWVLGDLYTFKATGKQTSGTFTIIDQVINPQSGPPPHIHHREDETFYIHQGKFSFLCGDNESILEAGSFAYIPKGTLHTFKNIGEDQGRIMVIITPAGLEEFFYKIGTRAVDGTTPPAFDPSVMEKIFQLSKEFQMEIILPAGKQEPAM